MVPPWYKFQNGHKFSFTTETRAPFLTHLAGFDNSIRDGLTTTQEILFFTQMDPPIHWGHEPGYSKGIPGFFMEVPYHGSVKSFEWIRP
jgi:hypothetical protein